MVKDVKRERRRGRRGRGMQILLSIANSQLYYYTRVENVIFPIYLNLYY